MQSGRVRRRRGHPLYLSGQHWQQRNQISCQPIECHCCRYIPQNSHPCHPFQKRFNPHIFNLYECRSVHTRPPKSNWRLITEKISHYHSPKYVYSAPVITVEFLFSFLFCESGGGLLVDERTVDALGGWNGCCLDEAVSGATNSGEEGRLRLYVTISIVFWTFVCFCFFGSRHHGRRCAAR